MKQAVTPTKPGAAVAVTAIALGVDMFLYGSIVPLLPDLPAVHGSPFIAGALFAVYAVALLGATPFIGVWVDRSGPRAPMLKPASSDSPRRPCCSPRPSMSPVRPA